MNNSDYLDKDSLLANTEFYDGEEAEAFLRKMEYGSIPNLDQLILYPGKELEVLHYLTTHLDSKPVEAIRLLVAAREVGLTRSLTYKEATTLFGDVVALSTFNKYYRNNRPLNRTSVEAYKTALMREFPKPDGKTE